MVADYKIVMFVGNDAYPLTALPPCSQIQLALFMHLSTATSGTVNRFDHVLLDDQKCLIDQIQQIDNRHMRHDAAERAG